MISETRRGSNGIAGIGCKVSQLNGTIPPDAGVEVRAANKSSSPFRNSSPEKHHFQQSQEIIVRSCRLRFSAIRILGVLVLALSSITLTITQSEPSRGVNERSSEAKLAEQVDALFVQWSKLDSPGCALAVIKDGTIIYKRGYGMANLDYGIPISSASVFNIASVSKQFTAMTIALLAKQGKLSLDDDFRQYVPEFPRYQSPITIRNLIYQTSGIREYSHLMSATGIRFQDATDDKTGAKFAILR